MRPVLLALLLFAAATAASAQAQKIYRCGPDGRQLQQQPCGSAAPLTTAPAPSGAERAEAGAIAKREARHAERMTAEREKREREQAKNASLAVGIGPPPRAASAPKAGKKKAPPKKRPTAALTPPLA